MERYLVDVPNADGDIVSVEVSLPIYEVMNKEENRIVKREEYRQARLYTLVDKQIMENHSGCADYSFNSTIEEIELLDMLDSALAKCTSKQRRRFKLYFYQQWTIADIAKKEQTQYYAIYLSITQVREKLKKEFFINP